MCVCVCVCACGEGTQPGEDVQQKLRSTVCGGAEDWYKSVWEAPSRLSSTGGRPDEERRSAGERASQLTLVWFGGRWRLLGVGMGIEEEEECGSEEAKEEGKVILPHHTHLPFTTTTTHGPRCTDYGRHEVDLGLLQISDQGGRGM